MKKLFTIFLLAILPLVANAELGRVKVNGVYYFENIESHDIGVGASPSDDKYSGDIVIPESFIYEGVEYKVDYIGQEAFYKCVGVTSVTIGNGVKYIERNAFDGCTNMVSLTIGNNLTKIGPQAFQNCSSLLKLTIPNSVTDIGSGAFNGCNSLISVALSESLTTIQNNTFSMCSGLTSVNIPESVTSIGNGAFYSCSGLTSMTIPPSVTEIGESIFGDCRGLASVTIPNSITTISKYTFIGCVSLNSVTIPNSVTSIGDGAFSGCESLVSITIPESVTSIGESAFASCWRLTSVTLPSTLKFIKTSAFQYCDALESITIPAAVEYIYQNVFANCDKLKKVESLAETPPFIYANTFANYDISLFVPEGSVDAYKAADNWNKFTEINAIKDGTSGDEDDTPDEEETSNETIYISSAEQTTYCSENDLDFTNVEGLKAYTAGGYNRTTGTIWLMRVYEVPAGEGILLIGAGGDYKVPQKSTTTYYANLMVGTLEAKTINETDGEYTNYYLSSGTHGVGFYKVNGSVEIKANRAYLPLLKSATSGSRGFIGLDFGEGEGTTGIRNLTPALSEGERTWYNLQGQRVENPRKGLYIHNGKMVVIN